MAVPLASVVVLNYNGKHFLEACLSSLEAQTHPNYEVILVDNASTDGSTDYVREHFPAVRIIENERNEFFVGNNRGIAAATGKYVAVLNNDTRADSEWLGNLVEAAEQEDSVGMCASKVLSLHDADVIDSVGLVIYRDGMSRARGRGETDCGQYDRVEEVLLPSACAALYRRQMLDEIGFFDPDFVAYCEDTDLGLRGRLAGWKAILVPSAVVYHHYSGSWGSYSAMKAYLVERNHFWVVVKNFPRTMLVGVPFYTLWRYLVQAYGLLSGRGSVARFPGRRSELLWVLARAWLGALAGLPTMLRKRRMVQTARRVPASTVARWFREYGMSATDLVLVD